MSLNSIRISVKIWFPTLVATLGIVTLIAVAVTFSRDAVVEERQAQVRAMAEAAREIAAHYHERAEAGELETATAQTRALEAIRAIRYSGGAEYVFVYEYDGLARAMPPRPEWEGTNKLDLRDSDGEPMVADMIAAARTGGGAVSYRFPRAGQTKPEPKVSWAAGFDPWDWMIGTGVYVSDVDAAAMEKGLNLAAIALVVMALAAGTAFIVIRGITHPLKHLTKAMTALAGGNLETVIPDTNRRDEIGEMAGAIEVFKDNAQEVQRLQSEQATQQRRNARRVRGEMLALTNALDEEVRRALATVLSEAGTMHDAAIAMTKAVSETEHGADAAASASRDASNNVDAVAAASEELSNSISEIGGQVSNAADVARLAVDEANATNEHVSGLAKAANEIGDVVNLISDIAKQTNLLALNATIEAARAGEAGKGFAVVANEVKTLATQTAKATEDIAAQIGGMQAATNKAVEAIERISTVIGQLNEISTAISAAVEEQTAATGEISHNAQLAARSTQDSSDNINSVSQSSETTGGHARSVKASAEEVRTRVAAMQTSLERIIRSSSDEDREGNRLRTVNVAATLTFPNGSKQSCLLQELSLSGVGTLDRVMKDAQDKAFEITLSDIGTLPGSIVTTTDAATHIRLDVGDAETGKLKALLARYERG
ncbi:methyl-accepting chemotaxis protein [Rhodospira trueperi]|uniref:Methyl-accepting chemotaxis protein n=1 Tax=Rhodospira trueperi TaxID=69960 RepID=A0A1G7GDS2_9PROT|nr:cache domain-containing protein [Rhodospira trueperi]SDE86235.1 methyl-accepting chemotaxis protein [Rhodospira trueperi]